MDTKVQANPASVQTWNPIICSHFPENKNGNANMQKEDFSAKTQEQEKRLLPSIPPSTWTTVSSFFKQISNWNKPSST